MQIPPNLTEQQVLDSIEKIANGRLPHLFKFGYNTLDDMKQNARVLAIEGLSYYESSKGSLDTFLWIYVHNRLYNDKRNKSERPKPCLSCPLAAYDPHLKNSTSGCTAFADKMDCKEFASWQKINFPKKNLMNLVGISTVVDENEERMKTSQDMDAAIDYSDIVDLIDQKIPTNFRKDWIKLKTNINIPKSDKRKLIEQIKLILEEAKIDAEEER